VAAELAAAGYVMREGKPYEAAAIKRMRVHDPDDTPPLMKERPRPHEFDPAGDEAPQLVATLIDDMIKEMRSKRSGPAQAGQSQ